MYAEEERERAWKALVAERSAAAGKPPVLIAEPPAGKDRPRPAS